MEEATRSKVLTWAASRRAWVLIDVDKGTIDIRLPLQADSTKPRFTITITNSGCGWGIVWEWAQAMDAALKGSEPGTACDS